jgi:hypothetical protein
MKNTADGSGGKLIAVLLQSILGGSAINLLVAFYDIHGGKRKVLFYYFFPDTTRDEALLYLLLIRIYYIMKYTNNILLAKLKWAMFCFEYKQTSRRGVVCDPDKD